LNPVLSHKRDTRGRSRCGLRLAQHTIIGQHGTSDLSPTETPPLSDTAADPHKNPTD